VDGALELGPNAVLALHREADARFAVRPADVAAVAAWPGTWRMAARHWRTGLTELRDSASIGAAVRAAQRYVPELRRSDVRRGRTGVRAQAVALDGTLVDDFVVEVSGGVISVRNAPSPAATSSLAIAEHLVDRLAGDL
jgi:L-2-hydroxyglutarate oxidase LhgO